MYSYIKIKKKIFYLLKSIYGFNVKFLLNNINYKLKNNYIKDKGLIGKIIEFYLLNKLNNINYCDILSLNIEIKTISLDLFGNINNDIFLMSFKLSNFFKLINYNSIFFKKIKKILWVPIIGNRNISFKNKIIGNFFLSVLSNKDIKYILKELNNINNFIWDNKNIFLPTLYSRYFKFQFFNINKCNLINYNNISVKIYFNKSFFRKKIKNII